MIATALPDLLRNLDPLPYAVLVVGGGLLVWSGLLVLRFWVAERRQAVLRAQLRRRGHG